MNTVLLEVSDLLVRLEKDDWFCLPGSRDAFGSAIRRLQSRPESGFITGSGEGVCAFFSKTQKSHPACHPA